MEIDKGFNNLGYLTDANEVMHADIYKLSIKDVCVVYRVAKQKGDPRFSALSHVQ